MNAPAFAAAPAADIAFFRDLDSVERDARGALDRTRQSSMFDRLYWLRLTRTHVLPDTGLLVARAEVDRERCWLPLRAEGSRADPFASWYTLAFAPIFDAAEESRHALLAALAGSLRRRLARIDLAPLDPDTATLIANAFAEAGWRADRADATANWIAHVGGRDFASYWNDRPSRLRNTVRRKARAAALDLEISERFDARLWADYETIYRASWKPEEGSPAFLRALAEQEGAAGTLRLGIARREGRAFACQFWTVENGVAIIHKLAHLESERACSPGSILSEAMFRHAIDRDRVNMIDFGTGDDAYKADWMDRRRMLTRLTLFNLRSIAGLTGAARRIGAGLVRQVHRG